MRLHGHGLRAVRTRRGRPARVVARAVLAFSFALVLWPCCDLLAGVSEFHAHPGGTGMPGDQGHSPGPCGWMDANDIPVWEAAPTVWSGPYPAPPAPSTYRSTAVATMSPPRASVSRGPPGPRYLELRRLLL